MTVLLLDDAEMRRVRGAAFLRGAVAAGCAGAVACILASGIAFDRGRTREFERVRDLGPCACGGIPASEVRQTILPTGQTIAFRDALAVEVWPAACGRIAVVARPGVPIAIGVGTVAWPDGREFDRNTPGAVPEEPR